MGGFTDKFLRFTGSPQLASLVAANLFVWLAVTVCGWTQPQDSTVGNLTLPWLCVPSDPGLFATHPWTVFTYMFTQYDFLHLLFNLLWLLWFGKMLQDAAPGYALGASYLTGGLTGGLVYIGVSLLPDPNPVSWLCGSSAAVLSVMATCAMLTPNRPTMLLIFGTVKLKWVAALCAAVTIVSTGGSSIGAQSAHIAGISAGIAAALFIRKSQYAHNPESRKHISTDPSPLLPGDSQRLDILLNKIHISGFRSLSERERTELSALSARLKNRQQVSHKYEL